MAERGKAVRAVGLSDEAYFRICRWKAAWSATLETKMTWAEFLSAISNDRRMWPNEGRQ